MKTLHTKTMRTAFTTAAILGAFVVTLATATIQPAFAAETNDLATKKKALSEVSSRVSQLRNAVATKQRDIKTLNDQMQVIDQRVELIQLQLQETQEKIDLNAGEIARTEEEIAKKQDEMDAQKAVMDSVVRKIYMEKDINMVSIVVESKNFSQLVEKTEYLARIRSQLKETVEKLAKLKDELEGEKLALEEKQKELEQLKLNKQAEENGLEDQKYAKAKIMEQTRGEEETFKAQLASARAEEQAASAEVIRLVQEAARRTRSEGVEGRPGRPQVVNSGGFGYPLPGENRIGVTGGDFMDPAYGMGFPHTGVDLRAGQGTTVFSAGAGVVVAAFDSGGPGLSYIAVDHGNGLITKYLHMSAIYVNQGDVVNAGDPIGLSGGSPGSRGAGLFTTGAHLHFEINDYKGTPINPHNYLNILPPLF